ncbi:MAG: class I SAM-dependent rRNA methyltransferase [Pseudomonadota bacterium]
MTPSPLSVVRLKPKVRPQAIRHGFPWVYDNELVTDRRTKALAPGSLAVLQDTDREALALVSVNPKSRIIARVLDRNLDMTLDQAWINTRLGRALQMREQLFDAPFYRIVHAEADGMPGVIIDRFGDTAVIQPNAAWAENHLDQITTALKDVVGISTVVKNASGRARSLEGLDDKSGVLLGIEPAAPVKVVMNNATYMADLTGGQKTGLFYDQRLNQSFAAGLAKDAKVLDVFSHVGGFALACLAGGAGQALSIDSSEAALDLATQGAARMGVAERFETRRSDGFDALAALSENGERFDLVICDPPAFAPNKKALEAGLRAYERVARLAAPLVNEGGYLCLCSCSHAASLEKFRASCLRGIGRAGRAGSLIHTGFAAPDHPLHPHLAESGYLKALFFRL